MNASDKHRQLIEDGFCTFENVLDATMLEEMRCVTDEMIDRQTDEEKEKHKYTGSLISLRSDTRMGQLIGWPKSIESLNSLGYSKPKFTSGYVISKPPKSPSLFWHQDWWGWQDPISYTDTPQQLFLMYYLVDTTPENGCLRVIPGSHRKRHPLHNILKEAHSDETYKGSEDSPEHSLAEGEIDVCVKAGDLVVGDSRLLHAAHANVSDTRRTVVTIWYVPLYDELPDSLRAAIGSRYSQQIKPDHWTDEQWSPVEPLIPRYEGEAQAVQWDRNPSSRLA